MPWTEQGCREYARRIQEELKYEIKSPRDREVGRGGLRFWLHSSVNGWKG